MSTARKRQRLAGAGDATPLPASRLRRRCPARELAFDTTDELEPLDTPPGQERALEALSLGTSLERDGYNLYVLGSAGLGRHTLVQRFLDDLAARRPAPPDRCYVHNFRDGDRPRVLTLPAGTGEVLRRDMAHCVEELLVAIPATFQGDAYREQVQALAQGFSERQENAFEALGAKARERGIALLRTPNGYTLAPLQDDKVLGPREFAKLPEAERQRIEAAVEELKQELQQLLTAMPGWQRESRAALDRLNRETVERAVGSQFDELEARYAGFPDVLAHLRAVREDVVENVDAFRPGDESANGDKPATHADALPQYTVNLLVDHAGAGGAPVVYEDNPTFSNLVGRIEHTARFGALVTNFTLIKPGALHRANGGYLVLDAARLLTQPFAWDGLKRALRSRELRLESIERQMSLLGTASLEPEPIPLDVKIVLCGDRLLYYLLREYDEEFGRLFKVAADFAEDIERTPDSVALMARLVAGLVRRDGLRPLQRGAVARVVEHCARRAEDAERLSVHTGSLLDLLRESDHAAAAARSKVVRAVHVERAVEASLRRVDAIDERMREQVLRGFRHIDTDGAEVAQVNGLSVYGLGEHRFGHPMRITATARLGAGEVVDIEREVELGGHLHSKGVLILSAFLGARYARDQPLPLAASLVFEQSYGEVEGDSASMAELCALLSALSGLPLRQSLAITGSVDQHGRMQAIGGVNEKIEGFFDICAARGLSGRQGVVIPAANVATLMLREDVVAAARRGEFGVYAVATVDEAIALLTGVPAGEHDLEGGWPADSVNGRVQARVHELNALRRRHAEKGDEGDAG